MSATHKTKPLSKDKLIQALTEMNSKLNDDNILLTEALQKEREGDIRLPMAPSVGQYNRIVEWCKKIKNYYNSADEAPELVELDAVPKPPDE